MKSLCIVLTTLTLFSCERKMEEPSANTESISLDIVSSLEDFTTTLIIDELNYEENLGGWFWGFIVKNM